MVRSSSKIQEKQAYFPGCPEERQCSLACPEELIKSNKT